MTPKPKETFTPSGSKEIKENNEKLTQEDILKFKNIAEAAYTELYNNNDTGINQAIGSLEKKLFEFKKIIESKGLHVNGNNFEELAKNITEYFDKVGYIFKPGITPIGNGKVSLNLSLYKKISSRTDSLSSFNIFGKINKSIKINYVETTIGSYQNYKGFINDGLTIMGKNGDNQVLIFPKNLKKIAKIQNIKNLDAYQDSVEINELSQVYFSEFIPNQFLGIKLNDFIKVPNKNWTLHHVLEAYSDYETLKQGDFFEKEVERIKNSTAQNYDFSKNIILKTIEYKRNSGDKTSLKNLILEQYELNIVGIIKAFNGYLNYLNNLKK